MISIRVCVILIISLVSLDGISKVEVAGEGTLGKKEGRYIKDKSEWQGLGLDRGQFKVVKTTASVWEVELAEDEKGVRVEFIPEVAFATRGLGLKPGQIIPAATLTSTLAIDPGMPPKEVSFGKIKAKISGKISISIEEYKKRGHLNDSKDGDPDYKIVIETAKESVTFSPPVNRFSINEIMWIGDLNADDFPDVLLHSQAHMGYPQILLISKRVGKVIQMENMGEIPGTAGVFRETKTPE